MRKVKKYRNATREEILKAVEIIKFGLYDDIQATDYYKQGDKDTEKVAIAMVFKEHGLIKNDIDELPDTKIGVLASKYVIEIADKYNWLVSSGKEEIKWLNELEKYIDDKYVNGDPYIKIEDGFEEIEDAKPTDNPDDMPF